MLKEKVWGILFAMAVNILLNSEVFAVRQFPWPGGQTGVVRQGFHDRGSGGYAIDFFIEGNPDVVATEAGTAYAKTKSEITMPAYCQEISGSVWNDPLRYVELDLPDGRKVFFLHLDSFASNFVPNGPGVPVVQGQVLGTMGNSGCVVPAPGGTGVHLHYYEKIGTSGVQIDEFEGRIESASRKGLSPVTSTGPEGYPVGDQYLSYNGPAAQAIWHPSGTPVREDGDTEVYVLQKNLLTGKIVKQHITQTAFNNSGLDWNAVVSVSREEIACYDEGTEITGTFLDLNGVGPHREGTLVKQCEGCSVYGASQGEFHHINVSAEEFTSLLRYEWENVETITALFPIGAAFSMTDFRKCENKHVAFIEGGIGSGSQDMPNDYSTGNPPPRPDQTLAGNNMLFAARYYDGESLQGFSSAGVKLWGISGTGEIAFDGVKIYAIGCDDVYKTLVHIDPVNGTVQNTFRLAFDGDIGTCVR